MIVADIQKSSIKEQRLQFIRNHQQAFDVEPIYPLRLFEDFVMGVEGDCAIEASCKIELDKLIASRFMLFFKDQEWQKYLAQSLAFFRQVENRVGVQLDYSLLQQLLGINFDFNKVTVFSTGVDLRNHLADSSVKMHIRLEDYPEKINQALLLTDDPNDLLSVRDFLSVIGLDFYFDGRSAIEIYPEVVEADFLKAETQEKVWRHFPRFVLEPLEVTSLFGFGFSKANNNPVLYYQIKNRQN